MLMPTVHLNGTSSKELLAQAEKAYYAVDAAFDAVSAASPNARDYYVQGERALAQAVEEHAAHLKSLRLVLDDYLNMIVHLT